MKKNPGFAKKILGGRMSLALASAMLGVAGCSSADAPRSSQNAGESVASSSSQDSSSEVATYADLDAMDLEFTDRDMDDSYDAAKATKVSLSGTGATIEGDGATATDGIVTIGAEGTYIVSGDLEGQLVVDTTKETKLQVVLAGVNIENASGPAIYVKQADKCFITLAEGTENILADGTDYVLDEGEDEPNATLFSKDDLTINGKGSLTVSGTYKHGVYSKDDLVITGGTYTVTSANDALRGKDCTKIADGTFELKSGEDAVKSSRDDDPALGFVLIEGGSFKIDAGDDAVHGETALFMNGGTLDIVNCTEGLEAMVVTVNDGEVSIVASDDALNASAPGNSSSNQQDMRFDKGNGDATGAMDRGFKGSDGADAGDGNMPQMPNGADAGDGNMPQMPNGADATSPQAPEGTDAVAPQPPDGADATAPQAPDDADATVQQAPDGTDATAMRNMQGGFPGASNENCQIYINGGKLTIQASGDAIDSNGSVEINDGTVLVTGPTSDGDSAFDYDISATVNGGTVLMVGSSGMAQDFNGGTQPFLFAQMSGSAGQAVTISDESGQELISFTPTANYQVVQASCPQFTEGGSYKVTAGDASKDVTASCTPSGNGAGAGFARGGFGGKGGNRIDGTGTDDGTFPGRGPQDGTGSGTQGQGQGQNQGQGQSNGYGSGDGTGTGSGLGTGNGTSVSDGDGRGSGDGTGTGPGVGGGNGLHDGTHLSDAANGGGNVQSA